MHDDKDKNPEIIDGIAPEKGDGRGWGHILSVDENGDPVPSPDEERVIRESDPDPDKRGIAPTTPPDLIG